MGKVTYIKRMQAGPLAAQFNERLIRMGGETMTVIERAGAELVPGRRI